ncbi:hypothetical protein [Nonomuraea zeae]|uniref:Uncharacterized protein n=1 Tax=Nonomuraea zeae TaxID=1642303 RepID=A0A5S4G065_9ACTN|nr:hypothetical protein [Nonomuraea zeae]TMR25761.1 hypothetical protein ETD85_44785 [Nonomuraea zeae]
MDPALSYERVADLLRAQVPEFGPALQEHLTDFGEVLQHVLFGDFTRFVLDAHRQGQEALVEPATGRRPAPAVIRCFGALRVAWRAPARPRC